MLNGNTILPTRIIEGLTINYLRKVESVNFPLSTYETPLFASVSRGVKVSKKHPITIAVISNNMTRSAIFECNSLIEIEQLLKFIENKQETFKDIVKLTSKHCNFTSFDQYVVGNLLYLRFSYTTDEASGHNMTTIATNEIAKFIVIEAKKNNINVEYISNSGNICCDKKVSAINSLCQRGKNVVAEIIVSKTNCEEILHTTPIKIVELNTKKNFIGSILGGSICSANAHYANMLGAIFLPLGQDIANIVEGSQGITYCNLTENEDLYFSVNLPNVICGCIGNGKDIDFVKNNLKLIGCIDQNDNVVINSSERMASIICACVLCGELSLMATLTNQDELVRSHIILERKLHKS